MSLTSLAPSDASPDVGAEFGPLGDLALSWSGADRPEAGTQRPGGRARRLVVASCVALALSGLVSLATTIGPDDGARQIGGDGVGAVSRETVALEAVQLVRPSGS